jgi:hypothetical protein
MHGFGKKNSSGVNTGGDGCDLCDPNFGRLARWAMWSH